MLVYCAEGMECHNHSSADVYSGPTPLSVIPCKVSFTRGVTVSIVYLMDSLLGSEQDWYIVFSPTEAAPPDPALRYGLVWETDHRVVLGASIIAL